MSATGWRDDPGAVDADDALILIPSLGTTSRVFDELVAGMRVRKPALGIVRADLPGHGTGSTHDRVTIPDLAQEVADVIERMNARRVTVAGVSMGGAIALETARLRPAGLRGFAMINSGIRFGSTREWQRLIELVSRSGMGATVPGAEVAWFSPAFARTSRARSLLADITSIDAATYVACCRALEEYRGHETVSAIDSRAVLVATSDDGATPPSGLRGLARLLPSADFFELRTGRHLSLVEHAMSVETILANSLDREG